MPLKEVLSSVVPLLRERHPKMSLLELFCAVDDFWQVFAPAWRQKQLASGQRQRDTSERLE